MLPLNPSPWRNPRLYFVLLLVFVCGAGTGAMVFKALVYTGSAKANNSTPTWREGGKEFSLRQMVKELNLKAEQSAAIETELDDFTMYYQMLQAQMDEVRATGKERIRAVLNPEQRVKFDRMLEEFRGKKIE